MFSQHDNEHRSDQDDKHAEGSLGNQKEYFRGEVLTKRISSSLGAMSFKTSINFIRVLLTYLQTINNMTLLWLG